LHLTVQRAVGCIEASCEAMWALPSMILMPAYEIGTKLVFAAAWLVIFAFVLSNGSILPQPW